jgi:arginine deiminase
MHLDTVFNIVNNNTCVMLEDIIGKDSPLRRLVTEYTVKKIKLINRKMEDHIKLQEDK